MARDEQILCGIDETSGVKLEVMTRRDFGVDQHQGLDMHIMNGEWLSTNSLDLLSVEE
jgi:hypothetical protein